MARAVLLPAAMRSLALLALLASACGPMTVAGPPPPQSAPDGGTPAPVAPSYVFSWNNGCILSCAGLDVAIAEGSSSAIAVSPGLAGVASVATSDPSVVTFSLGEKDIAVDAHSPGTADLVLLDAAGTEVAHAPVRVAATTKLAFDLALPGQKLIVYDGAGMTFHVSTVGPGDEATVGLGGVTFSSSGAAQLSTIETIFGGDGDAMIFSGYGGTGTVTARSPHASVTLEVEFVAPTQLVSIETSVVQEDGYTDVRFVSSTPEGAVYGAWPNCTSEVQELTTGITGIDDLPYSFYRYALDGHGSFTLACQLGAHKLVVPVSY